MVAILPLIDRDEAGLVKMGEYETDNAVQVAARTAARLLDDFRERANILPALAPAGRGRIAAPVLGFQGLAQFREAITDFGEGCARRHDLVAVERVLSR